MDAIKKTKARPHNKPKKSVGKPKSGRLSIRNYYEAGRSTGRHLFFWQPGMPGPNTAILGSRQAIISRSRDLYRNNGWYKRGVDSWAANEVGTGFTFKAASSDSKWNETIDELWERQCRYFDAAGQLSFVGLMTRAVRTRLIDGEVFARFRLRRESDGLPVRLQLEFLEQEFCPDNLNQSLGNGRSIRAGIEFNPINAPVAYWLYRRHPNDAFADQINLFDTVRVDADAVIQHFDPTRSGQIRGISPIAASMIKAKDFDEYDFSELLRKKNRSAFTGAIQRPNYNPDVDDLYDPLTGEPINKDTTGIPVTDIQAGQFFSLLPGEEAKLFDGDNTGQGYPEFQRQQLLGMAAAQSVPYEFLTWDFSALNDRTLRVVLAEYHRCIEQVRWALTIPQLCEPIWEQFVRMAIAFGSIEEPKTSPEDYLKVTIHPEGWPYLHEMQDVQADILALKAGLTSRKRIKGEAGEDIREIDQERKEDADRSKKYGLTDDFGGTAAPAAGNGAEPDSQNPTA